MREKKNRETREKSEENLKSANLSTEIAADPAAAGRRGVGTQLYHPCTCVEYQGATDCKIQRLAKARAAPQSQMAGNADASPCLEGGGFICLFSLRLKCQMNE